MQPVTEDSSNWKRLKDFLGDIFLNLEEFHLENEEKKRGFWRRKTHLVNQIITFELHMCSAVEEMYVRKYLAFSNLMFLL